ncbi:DUF6468 domain-containing protein [Haematospirillum jordaniae]|uniref:DUF6468 domain-containing protein n=1 Tax=Haematospirillum jordaniae TaxID=1549855 RepID=UPI001432A4B5|nr:DUF6468 domain-containing protein [Haematospirillum jordaniae]NKD92156.1 hypothetical protein [Haematospirillum jordaniae]
MDIALILDVLVVLLLVPTIVFAVLLNNRLSALRRNREDLARLIAAFNEATVRAESGIPRLRKAGEDAGRLLQEKIERAQVLRDDLAFMVERASAMAERLDGAARAAKDKAGRALSSVIPASGNSVSGGPPVDPVAAAESVVAAAAAAAAGLSASGARVPPPAQLDIESAAAAAEYAENTSVARVPSATEIIRDDSHVIPDVRPVSQSGLAIPQPPSLGSALATTERAEAAIPPKRVETERKHAPIPRDDDRSEAEKELLRALRSVR